MTQKREVSRRQFVASAAAVAGLSSLPARNLFTLTGRQAPAAGSSQAVPLIQNPEWKDQGVENLAKSPHAKLRNIPVRAVTIKVGFWGARREVNVTKSIPTMHDLL